MSLLVCANIAELPPTPVVWVIAPFLGANVAVLPVSYVLAIATWLA
jgi:C4-dicarboxylate transporter DctM subunit